MFGLIDYENELLRGLEQAEYQEPPSLPKGIVESDRWVCASAMQKAVRRGQLKMALKAAFSLKRLHPQQLWSRLRTICLEDIGAANPILAGQVLWVAGKRVWREQNGGEDKTLSYLITQMCQSFKSRMANDLLVLSNWHPDYKQACETLADYSHSELEKVLMLSTAPVVLRTIAAHYIHGTSPRTNHNLLERKGSPKALKAVYAGMDYPPFLMDIISMGLGRGEGHGITIGLACQHQEENEPVDLVDECIDLPIKIGEWYSEHFDAHVRDGKQAYNFYLKRNPKIKNFLNQHFAGKNHNAIIGMVIFGLEGHLMNNRVIYKSEEKLTYKAMEAYVDDGFTGDIKNELTALVVDSFDAIHEARKDVVLRGVK